MMNETKTKIKMWAAIAVGSCTVLFYQNCAGPVSQSSYVVSGLTEFDIAQEKAVSVMTAKCASCHNSTAPSGGVDVTDLDGLLASGAVVPAEPGLSPLFQEVSGGTMPPSGGLPQDDIMAISDWITAMQKDTGVSLPPGTSLPLGPNYASIYQNILKNSCLGCHNSANSQGGVSFSTYNSTMNTVQKTLPNSSGLYTAIAVRNTMPQGAGGSLSAAQKSAVFDWITAGAPNN